MTRFNALRRLVVVMALTCAAPLAWAHPHVLVSVRSVLVLGEGQKPAAIRQIWTFDEGFSSYATLGMDTDKDGKLSREELAPLAKVNIESLAEYAYFTVLKKGKESAGFGEIKDFHLDHDGKHLTLTFVLPLTGLSHPLGELRYEVYDPTFFVAFSFAEKEPIRIEGDAGRCRASLKPPGASVMQRLSQLGEGFFAQQGSQPLQPDWSTPVSFSCK